jgi:hypothetical protein
VIGIADARLTADGSRTAATPRIGDGDRIRRVQHLHYGWRR